MRRNIVKPASAASSATFIISELPELAGIAGRAFDDRGQEAGPDRIHHG